MAFRRNSNPTKYEFLRFPGGGSSFKNDHGDRANMSTRSLKSKNAASVASQRQSLKSGSEVLGYFPRRQTRESLRSERTVVRSPMVLQPPEPDSIGKSGVRKASPTASPENTQQLLDDARNVRAKQNHSRYPYNLIYV